MWSVCRLMHWISASNKCQLWERLRRTFEHNKQPREIKRGRQRERGRVKMCRECRGHVSAAPAKPGLHTKRVYCSYDGCSEVTSVHQPRAASLLLLFWPLWFVFYRDAIVMRESRLLWFLFLIWRKSGGQKRCWGRWWDSRKNEENNFG